jgi:hypothetical protein
MARFHNDLVYYSFTMSRAQSGNGSPRRILAECVREASPAGRFRAPGGFVCGKRRAASQMLPAPQRFLNAN